MEFREIFWWSFEGTKTEEKYKKIFAGTEGILNLLSENFIQIFRYIYLQLTTYFLTTSVRFPKIWPKLEKFLCNYFFSNFLIFVKFSPEIYQDLGETSQNFTRIHFRFLILSKIFQNFSRSCFITYHRIISSTVFVIKPPFTFTRSGVALPVPRARIFAPQSCSKGKKMLRIFLRAWCGLFGLTQNPLSPVFCEGAFRVYCNQSRLRNKSRQLFQRYHFYYLRGAFTFYPSDFTRVFYLPLK